MRSFERALRPLCHDSVLAISESELGTNRLVFAIKTRQAGTLRSFDRALRPLCHDSVLAISEGEFEAKRDVFAIKTRQAGTLRSFERAPLLMNSQVCSAEPLDKAAWLPELPRR